MRVRTVFPWSVRDIESPSDDYLCEVCEDKPAVKEGIEYQQTRLEPAEWMGVCEDHGGGEDDD